MLIHGVDKKRRTRRSIVRATVAKKQAIVGTKNKRNLFRRWFVDFGTTSTKRRRKAKTFATVTIFTERRLGLRKTTTTILLIVARNSIRVEFLE